MEEKYGESQDNLSQEILEVREKLKDKQSKDLIMRIIQNIEHLGVENLNKILDKILELNQFEGDSLKTIYDIEGFEFDTEDVLRALNREYKIKRFYLDKTMHHGGRPPEVEPYVRLWKHFKDNDDQDMCDNVRYDAEIKLSRTSFWRFKKEVIKEFPEEEKWI